MSSSSFVEMDYSENPNPIPNYTHHFTQNVDPSFEYLSNYLMLDDHDHGFDEYSSSQSRVSSEKIMGGGSSGSSGATSRNKNIKCANGVRKKVEEGIRVTFRTKSELEIMDDGFKWRKYGKKSVKNSPNPRNYYRCSSGGCPVKKRVEREREDSSYVLTTYEGVHNHESPSVVYYNQNQMAHMVPNAWTSQSASFP